MPVILKIKNGILYYIYFTVKCLKEPIHIHIHAKGPYDDGKSAKLWLLSNGEFREEHRGIFETKEYAKVYPMLIERAYENREKILEEWFKRLKEYNFNATQIEYIDTTDRRFLQND